MNFRSISRLNYLGSLVVKEPQRLWRHLKFLAGGFFNPRYKRNAVIMCHTGGLGDNLMLTAVAREVKKRNPKALIHVITKFPAVFDRNPDVDFVSRKPKGQFPWMRPFRVDYTLDFPWKEHLLHSMCRCLNIPGQIELRTHIFPEVEDWEFAERLISELGAAPVVLARGSSVKTCDKKVWPLNLWRRLAKDLLRFTPVVDIGSGGSALDVSDPTYRSLLGKTSLHQMAALLGKSKALITMDSGPYHVAAAFGLPTVCILGGVIPPAAIQYPNAKVLTNRPDCCDCWTVRECSRNLECLVNIPVEQVLLALDELCPNLRANPSEKLQPINLSSANNDGKLIFNGSTEPVRLQG